MPPVLDPIGNQESPVIEEQTRGEDPFKAQERIMREEREPAKKRLQEQIAAGERLKAKLATLANRQQQRRSTSTVMKGSSAARPSLTQWTRSPLSLERETRTSPKRSSAPSGKSQAPVKRQRLDFTKEIQVIVGQEKQVVNVPRTMLTKSSKFLQSTCDDLSESDAKVKLPWALPEIFAIYQQFLYTGDVVIVDMESEDATQEIKVDYFKKLMEGLVEAYVLADMLSDPIFKNGIIDLMLDEYGRLDLLPNAKVITRAYTATLSGSHLREALVAMYCHGIDVRWLDEHAAVLPPLFLTDIIRAFAKAHDEGVRLGDPARMDRCVFHEHIEGVSTCV